jgi:PAS domain S-box-containing protein
MESSVSYKKDGTPHLIVSSQTVTFVSDSLEELTGYPKEALTGAGFDTVLSRLRLTRAGSRLATAGRAEGWMFTKSLEAREVIITRQDNGRDIVYRFTEKPHTRLEEVLAYACRLLEENITGVSIFYARDLTLLKANQTCLDFCDGPDHCPEMTYGRTIDELIDRFEGSRVEDAFNDARVTGKTQVVKELRYDLYNRGVTYWDQHITPVWSGGSLKYFIVVFIDITERKTVKDALAKSEAALRSVLDHSGDFIYSLNTLTNTYEYVSPAAAKVLGCTTEEFMAVDIKTFHDSVHPDDKPVFEAALAALDEHNETEIRFRQRMKDGEYRWLVNHLTDVKDADGRVLYRNGRIRDITEQTLMEQTLRERDMHLRMAAEGAKLGTYAFDILRGTVFVSAELKALWGLQPDEPVPYDSELFFRGLHPDDKRLFVEKIAQSNDPDGDGLIEMDYRVILPDGAIKWLHVEGQTIFSEVDGKRQAVYASGVVIDITRRVAAEKSVLEKSAELQNIIDSTEDLIYSVDREFRLVVYNSAFGAYAERSLGKKLKKGIRMPEVLTMLDGSFWGEFFERVAREGQMQLEISVDEGARVLSLFFNPVIIDGQMTEMTVFARDITKRISSEREIIRLNALLEKRVMERTDELHQSISELRNFSRILSHDLKEPIRQIDFFAERAQASADSGIQADISEIRKTCGRMKRLIDGLSQYAMSSELKIKKENVNVRKMLTAMFSDMKASAPNGAILQFESGLPIAYADKLLLNHVLNNLLSNAMKFSSKRDVSEITVGCMETDGEYVFHIRDNGVGFDMQFAHKLFRAFERLHAEEEYDGSGIGLAAVRNIIERHGGRTWIESRENIGTTVYFTLPATPPG